MANNKAKVNIASKKVTKLSRNTIIMKILVFLGVIMLCFAIIYLMNYFFVEHNDIKINMSTDKKVEFINIAGNDKLITTQKYVSDLNYSMRYDINNFIVFKYRDQDFYKYKDEEKIIVMVEISKLPNNCTLETENQGYSKCTLIVDNFTEETYYTQGKKTFKITIKNPNTRDYEKNIKPLVDYMLKSFEMTDK